MCSAALAYASRQPARFCAGDFARLPCPLSKRSRQRLDVCGSCILRSAFDRTVMLHDGMTELGQDRAAAVLASFDEPATPD